MSLDPTTTHQLTLPYVAKIADINEDDTDAHYLDLETALSETRKIIGVLIYADRITGTGDFYVRPNEDPSYAMNITWGSSCTLILIKNATQRLLYWQTVANDDWDLICIGYIIEK